MKLSQAFPSFILAIFLLFYSVSAAQATLISVNLNGEVIQNVLAFDSELTPTVPTHSSLEVKNIAQGPQASPDTTVYLQKQEDKLQLTVETPQGKHEADITNYHDNIIEIEQTPQTQTINISAQADHFLINQNGIVATTDFPIQINTQKRELSVETPSGLKYLSILPYEAVENTLRANLINTLQSDNTITLSENDRGELEYRISGSKILNILNVLQYEVPVNTSVSASTGQVLNIDQPTWFSILGFLFA